ncbi:DUF3299 domain-containing protein [Planctobacterium marinum]|uniref:DUF3299 domain-containing protein n=1 Tax=Planctobacterium marinum TaxID=1631968 RepID=A0AA48I8Z1_9ALTE|nr:hypothetical protein MACH26_36660 [Planctobacterium marinum]
MKKVIPLLLTLLLGINSALKAETVELYWEDLIPEGYVPSDALPEIDHTNPMAQSNPNAPVRTDLNGKQVKIPGFVVPLEGDETITEFLLVPFFGACIHVPPPPSNQIVYVNFPEGANVDSLYDAVWVTGTLQTEGWTGDLATVGYNMTGMEIAPFE